MRTPEGKFRRRRHPLCPECKYDLIATVESHGRIYPECGYEFERAELRGEKGPGEWTIWNGLRNAIISLMLRSILILPFWTGLIWILSPLISLVPIRFGRAFGGFAVILCIPGFLIGHLLMRNLSERAGFSSSLLGLLSSIAAFGIIAVGVMISRQFHPLADWHATFTVMATSLFAIGWIVRAMVLED